MTAAEHPFRPEELMEYLDGELPPDRAMVVQAHVVACDVCQHLTGELRGVSQSLARWEVEESPATLMAPTLPEGSDRTAHSVSVFAWFRRRPALASVLSAAAVLSIVGAVGYGRLLFTQSQYATFSTGARESSAVAGAGERYGSGRPRGMREEPPADALSAEENSMSLLTPGPSGSVAARQAGSVASRQARISTERGPSIARTARLRLRSADLDTARPIVDRVIADSGGMVGQVNITGVKGDARSLTATLLIPANRLDGALVALKVIGLVLDESQRGEDVTDQVVDAGARLANARNTEKRLVDLLQKRTGNLADVLAAEREIARVREEIERFDAQRTNLERRVTYATLTLEVAEEQRARLDLGPVSARLRDAFVTGITDALDSALGLTLTIVSLGPVLLLWVVLLAWPVWFAVRLGRRWLL